MLASLSGAAIAGDAPMVERDGLILAVQASGNVATFSFDTKPGYRIAAGYGVEVSAPEQDAGFWKEKLPKTIADDDRAYFDLPLTFTLSSENNIQGHRLKFDLGICSQDELCNRVVFSLNIP